MAHEILQDVRGEIQTNTGTRERGLSKNPNNTEHQARNQPVPFSKPLVWLTLEAGAVPIESPSDKGYLGRYDHTRYSYSDIHSVCFVSHPWNLLQAHWVLVLYLTELYYILVKPCRDLVEMWRQLSTLSIVVFQEFSLNAPTVPSPYSKKTENILVWLSRRVDRSCSTDASAPFTSKVPMEINITFYLCSV